MRYLIKVIELDKNPAFDPEKKYGGPAQYIEHEVFSIESEYTVIEYEAVLLAALRK